MERVIYDRNFIQLLEARWGMSNEELNHIKVIKRVTKYTNEYITSFGFKVILAKMEA